ncbi:MAG: hypothetical protein ACD_64C00136G0001 [uncultured bacterium]|nr:MAG: hypothetical protein ACD_64C00136G0001 [uncultured bacterium]
MPSDKSIIECTSRSDRCFINAPDNAIIGNQFIKNITGQYTLWTMRYKDICANLQSCFFSNVSGYFLRTANRYCRFNDHCSALLHYRTQCINSTHYITDISFFIFSDRRWHRNHIIICGDNLRCRSEILSTEYILQLLICFWLMNNRITRINFLYSLSIDIIPNHIVSAFCCNDCCR